ncbi:hypothetical protein [Streptomyces sp. NPDC057460]|uniref:hypothetical protein n=1 Tax=Streptomyces sp. NPDC057460 TaxID=3346141 RepID=UPI00368C9954
MQQRMSPATCVVSSWPLSSAPVLMIVGCTGQLYDRFRRIVVGVRGPAALESSLPRHVQHPADG